jgi:RND family efflux transporter MFP subunit
VSQDLQAATNLTSDLATLRIDREAGLHPARRRLLYAVLLFAIAAALVLYFARDRITAQEVETVRPTVRRSTAASARPILAASGYLVARRKAVVSAKIQGRLAELDVDEGSWVTAGQVIARLDNNDLQAQIDVARAGVQQAAADLAEKQRQLQLTQGLANDGVVSQDQLQAAASRVRLADATLSQSKATLSLAETNLQNTIIRAPFAGVVVKKMAEVGESVAPIPPGVNLSTSSGAIVGMADMATLEAEADVSESNIAKLQRNQPAQVAVDAILDHTYLAVLRQVIPTADRTKATIMVKVRLLEKDENLRPEMSAKVTFLERAGESSRTVKPIITVPKDALIVKNGTTAVFVVDSQRKVHFVPVLIGGERQDEVIVDQGLAGTEALVLRPPSTLKDGDTVKPRAEETNA